MRATKGDPGGHNKFIDISIAISRSQNRVSYFGWLLIAGRIPKSTSASGLSRLNLHLWRKPWQKSKLSTGGGGGSLSAITSVTPKVHWVFMFTYN